jgi:glycerophosphoryl diester phosphodiesterase
MIELDVRRTRDNTFIVYHDERFGDAPINDLTYNEINKTSSFEIPTLEETLTMFQGKIKFDIELKEEGYEKEVVNFILKFLKEEEFVITSFNDNSLKIIKKLFPKIRNGLILGHPNPKNLIKTRISELFPIRRCRRAKTDFLVPHWRLLKFGFLWRVKKQGLPVFIWTVNERDLILKLLEHEKVDAIITDKIELAVELQQKSLNPEN